MANIKSAIKRARQNVKRNAHKSTQRSTARTAVKAVENAVGDHTKAVEAYKTMVPVIDRMADRGIIHKNKASRHKLRL